MSVDVDKKRSFSESFKFVKEMNPNVSKNGLRQALLKKKIPHIRTAEGKYARIRVSIKDLIDYAKRLEVIALK